jgi:WD40 repeat protein
MSPTETTATAVETSPAPQQVEQRKPLWEKRLSKIFWVNSVAISNDGTRVVAGTFIHDYDQKTGKFLPNVYSRFGVYFFGDVPKAQTARVDPKWSDEFDAWDGVYGVAISGDGRTVAASGWHEKNADTQRGLLRAYDSDSSTTDSLNLLLDFKGITQRVSWVSLSDDGRVLAAVADDVYVFIREGEAFNPVPLKLGVDEVANRYVTGIAVHPTGEWLAACDSSGHVHAATIKNGAIGSKVTWNAGKTYPFLSVAIARDVDRFVVGGGNLVFLFDLAGLMTNPNTYQPLPFDTAADEPDGTVPPDKPDKLQENVRWVAISADGTLITTVVNRFDGDDRLAGKLFARAHDLAPLWEVKITNNPNSTSIDAAGRFVTMADGWPTSKPAKFHLFNASGAKLWESGTCNMNWPMVISTDGTAIVAGSDDGGVYYFTP